MPTSNFNNTDWKTALPATEAGLRQSQITVPTADLVLVDGSVFEGGQHKHVATYTLDAGKKFNITKLPPRLTDQFFNVVVRWVTIEWVNGLSVNTNHAYMLYADNVTKWDYKLYDGETIYDECIFDIYITNPVTLYRTISPVVLETSINARPVQNYTVSPVGIVNEAAVTGDDVYAHNTIISGEVEAFQPKFVHAYRQQLELSGADYYLRDEVGDQDMINTVTGDAPVLGTPAVAEAEADVGTVVVSDGTNTRMKLDIILPALEDGGLAGIKDMWVVFQTKTGTKQGGDLVKTGLGSIGYSGSGLYWAAAGSGLGAAANALILDDDTWFIARIYLKDVASIPTFTGTTPGSLIAIEVRDFADRVIKTHESSVLDQIYPNNLIAGGWKGTNNIKLLALSKETFTDDEAEKLWKWLRGKYSTWVLGLGAIYDEEPPLQSNGAKFDSKLYGVNNVIPNQ
tara:strand:- start:33458 stop:34825 length:1368 start_codon:yes stop_codon:yes gene_type:complete